MKLTRCSLFAAALLLSVAPAMAEPPPENESKLVSIDYDLEANGQETFGALMQPAVLYVVNLERGDELPPLILFVPEKLEWQQNNRFYLTDDIYITSGRIRFEYHFSRLLEHSNWT